MSVERGTIARKMNRGYGFIRRSGGDEVFFHATGVADQGFDALNQGDEVEFRVEPDERGRGDRAVDVRPVSAPS